MIINYILSAVYSNEHILDIVRAISSSIIIIKIVVRCVIQFKYTQLTCGVRKAKS